MYKWETGVNLAQNERAEANRRIWMKNWKMEAQGEERIREKSRKGGKWDLKNEAVTDPYIFEANNVLSLHCEAEYLLHQSLHIENEQSDTARKAKEYLIHSEWRKTIVPIKVQGYWFYDASQMMKLR